MSHEVRMAGRGFIFINGGIVALDGLRWISYRDNYQNKKGPCVAFDYEDWYKRIIVEDEEEGRLLVDLICKAMIEQDAITVEAFNNDGERLALGNALSYATHLHNSPDKVAKLVVKGFGGK